MSGPIPIFRSVSALVLLALALLPSGCATVASLAVNGVGLVGNGDSDQIRQGAGSITAEIAGSGLAGITGVTLGTIDGTVVSSSAASATLRFDIPHGAPLGAQDLVVDSASGSATLEDAVVITAITAAAGSGDDSNRGTPDSPFATLGHALTVAAVGDTVQLLDGLYSDDPGSEQFPVDLSGLTLLGESQSGTILDGSKSNGGNGLEVLSGISSIGNLTVRDFGLAGVFASGGELTLDGITVHDVGREGVRLDGRGGSGLSATLDGVTVFDAGDDGIGLIDVVATVSDSSVSAVGDDGIDIWQDSIVSLTEIAIDSATEEGVIVSDVSSATLSFVDISGSGRFGIVVDDSAGVILENSSVGGSGDDNVHVRLAGEIDIQGSVIEESADDGIDIDGTGTVSLRDSRVVNNAGSGVEAQGSPDAVDLGDSGDPGDNTITGNEDFQIRDRRTAGLGQTILAHGTDFGVPLSGVVTGPGSSGNLWSIENDTSIDFGP